MNLKRIVMGALLAAAAAAIAVPVTASAQALSHYSQAQFGAHDQALLRHGQVTFGLHDQLLPRRGQVMPHHGQAQLGTHDQIASIISVPGSGSTSTAVLDGLAASAIVGIGGTVIIRRRADAVR
jgi:hypothetical protein